MSSLLDSDESVGLPGIVFQEVLSGIADERQHRKVLRGIRDSFPVVLADNEDHLHASQGVYVVADGMGGHEAGEVASALAVERIRETLADEEAAPTAERVVEAIASANGEIGRASCRERVYVLV